MGRVDQTFLRVALLFVLIRETQSSFAGASLCGVAEFCSLYLLPGMSCMQDLQQQNPAAKKSQLLEPPSQISISTKYEQFLPSGIVTLLILACLTLILSSPLYAGETIRIASQNMNRFFDNIDNGKNEKLSSETEFYVKVEIATTMIIEQFSSPDIIALQEVENANVLSNVATAVQNRSGARYQVILLGGNDVSAINTGFLVKHTVKIKSVKQLFKHQRLKLDQSLLFSRPPLYLEACKGPVCLSLLNLHLRSMRGIRSSTKGHRVRLKRLEQASIIARWIEQFQRARPQSLLLVLGDLNGLTPADSYIDVVGTILGKPDNSNTELQAVDWISNDLIDLTLYIPRKNRYSYIYRNKKQILDYMLASSLLKPRLDHISFSRIDYDFSDHAGLLVDLKW
jgi:predicted extracellular nuclease